MKSKVKKIIIGICIFILIVLIILGIFFGTVFYKFFDKIFSTVGNAIQENQKVDDTYFNILPELSKSNFIPEDWTYIDYAYEWGMETPDRTNRNYFYINKDNYNSYKHYWLEDVDKSKLKEDYNDDLYNTGDYVFHAINIDDLTPDSDSTYRNIKIYKDKTYYVVTIYKKALFYKDIIRFSSVDKYSTDNYFKIDRNSKSTELLFHQEDGKWVYEEIID